MDKHFKMDQRNEGNLQNIHQFLLTHNFKNTAEALIKEAANKGVKHLSTNLYCDNDQTPVDIYGKIFSSYETGDWKMFFQLWDLLIPENIRRTKEYKMLTLNLHVHFAIWPKRVLLRQWCKENDKSESNTNILMLELNQNEYKERENFMTEIEKNMINSMEQLREYLNTDGKELEHDAQLRPIFALPFIEDPYMESSLSKIFEENWLDHLTENLHAFINTYKQDLDNVMYDRESELLSSMYGLIGRDSESKTIVNSMQETKKTTIPIVANDRNIPMFFEDNDNGEQYGFFNDERYSQKIKNTETHAGSTRMSTDFSREDIHSSVVAKNDKRLIRYTQELAITKSHLCTVHSNYEKLKIRFHKLHRDYHKLISISGELTAALENSVKGQAVDLQAMLETCIKIFPELFNQNIRDSSQFSSAAQLEKSYGVSETSKYSALNVMPISPKLLDFKKLKLHLINGNVKTKLFLLQALRRKITLGCSDERDEAIHEYISKDLLGLHGQIASDNGKSILPYLLDPGNIIMPHPLQQSAARLLNVLASFRCGRDYLSFGSTVVNVIFKCLSNTSENEIDAFTCNMMIAMLQKLSLRKQQRIYMIENGLVEWLIHHLHDQCHVMDSYRLEYATALLMNLSLHHIAQRRASDMASLLITTLLTLLSIDNPSALPYVNGSLNNFLSNDAINSEAKKLKISVALEHYRKQKTGEIRKHLDHILKIHRGENTINIDDADTADDDNEEFDVLENELEENDPVKSYPGELCGEALLETYYVIPPQIVQDRSSTVDMSSVKHSVINSIPRDNNDQENGMFFHDHETDNYNKNLLPRSSKRRRSLKIKNKALIPDGCAEKTILNSKFVPNLTKLASTSFKDKQSFKAINGIQYSFAQDAEINISDDCYKFVTIDKPVRSKTKLKMLNQSSTEFQENIALNISHKSAIKNKNFRMTYLKNLKANDRILNKPISKDTVYLYENQTSKESSKTTVKSSTILSVASERESAEMEKLSSIASL